MTIVYAHRGAAAEQPENTLPSFRRALELGADALETDVHLTADGEVVAIHDADGTRVAGVSRAIRDCTLAEIREWDAAHSFVDGRGQRPFLGRGYRVPSLDELLRQLPEVRLNVDLKSDSPRLAARFLELVRAANAESRVTAASFFGVALKNLRDLGYGGETSLSKGEFLRCLFLPDWLAAKPKSATRAQIPTHSGVLRLDTPRALQKLHALALRVEFWTINDPSEARALVARGADGIFTDDPARIVPAVRAAGG